MDAACLPADARVREELARLCLLALADARPGMAVELGGAGSLERLAVVLAAEGG